MLATKRSPEGSETVADNSMRVLALHERSRTTEGSCFGADPGVGRRNVEQRIEHEAVESLARTTRCRHRISGPTGGEHALERAFSIAHRAMDQSVEAPSVV